MRLQHFAELKQNSEISLPLSAFPFSNFYFLPGL